MGTIYVDSGGDALNSGTSDNNAADLTGTGNATCVSSKTFATTDVNTTTDVITITAHGYSTGFGGEFSSTTTVPAGLNITLLYFLNVIDANTFTVHTNLADALAGTNKVDITSQGTGTHTFNNMTVSLGGSPSLANTYVSHFLFTTTGASHVFTTQGGNHGITTGDPVFFELQSGTLTGATLGALYYANALSATTIRLYSTAALAVAGGASDLTITGTPNRNLLIRSLVQQAIAIASSTVTNRKVFWIRAVDDTNDRVFLAVNVTGLGAGSNWKIGGRIQGSGLVTVFNAFRNGDVVIQNTDITISGSSLTWRNFEALGSGLCRWYGKAGARRLFAATAVSPWDLFNPATCIIENLEVAATSNVAIFNNGSGGSIVCIDVKFSDANAMVSSNGTRHEFYDCEFVGVDAYGSNTNATGPLSYNCYFHDMATAGPKFNSSWGKLINCIVERTTGIAVEITTGPVAILGCTIYRGDASGLKISNPLNHWTHLLLMDNIFLDNGNAGTEYNLDIAMAPTYVYDRRNVVSIAGARGGANALGITLDASDITSDPMFIDPDASAGSRNFGLKYGSPAAALTYTFRNSLSVSYGSAGAVRGERKSPKAQSMVGI